MTMNRLTGAVLCAFFAIATRVDAQAQATQQAIEFNERVIEITEPVIRGVMNGLDVQIRLLREFDQFLRTYKTPGEYRVCQGQVAASPELQKIMSQPLGWPENPTPEQQQRLSEKMSADMEALLRKKCGGDIINEWPEQKRGEKIEEIEMKAAAAAGPVKSSSRRQSGPAWVDETDDVDVVQSVGMLIAAYRIVLERISAWCQYKQVIKKQGYTPTPGYNVHFSASFINPKVSASIFFVYTVDEIKTIDKYCFDIELKIGQATIEQEAIYMAPLKIRGKSPIKTKR